MSPGATKLLALPRGCCVFPRGSLDDPAMEWCGKPALLGKSYCDFHRRKSVVAEGGDPQAGERSPAIEGEIIEGDAGARYRIERRTSHALGSHRQFRVVPIDGTGAPASASPGASSTAAAVIAPETNGRAVRAAQRPASHATK